MNLYPKCKAFHNSIDILASDIAKIVIFSQTTIYLRITCKYNIVFIFSGFLYKAKT